MKKLSIKDLSLKRKHALIRVDFNVPLNREGQITDDTRIVLSLPTIQYALEQEAALILMSHLDRPKGKKIPEMSLKPCAKKLSELLGREVQMAPDCIGPGVEKMVQLLKPGQILLLENLRFHPEEEFPEKDQNFVSQLAKLGDVYINDAFGSAHRRHASTAVIAGLFPQKAAAGFLIEKEMRFLGETLSHPKRPFYAIIGGAKISTKCGVIETLLHNADATLIGGGMAYTFLKAQGMPIGNSIHEDAFLDKARALLASCGKGQGRLLLPVDFVIANEIKKGATTQVVDAQIGIPDGFEGVDIGPRTIEKYGNELRHAATILWNGPLGVFEVPEFARGTNAIAKGLSELKAITIVGGGDSIAAVQAAGVANKITHLSTGGGASLEYIEFGTLPGIEALSDKVS